MSFTMDDVFESLRHPTDPTLFKATECDPGEYVDLDYLNKTCSIVEVTFEFWTGKAYVPAPPVRYQSLTRNAAFTKCVYELNTGAAINRMKHGYSNVRTREIREENNDETI